VSVAATVRTWHADEGWGVLDSDATPGGCWTHFSALDLDGDRSLSPGDQVLLVAESPGQDGFPWRAVRVVVEGRAPATPATTADADGAYSSTLVITWDDDS
jgi:cold shock protein